MIDAYYTLRRKTHKLARVFCLTLLMTLIVISISACSTEEGERAVEITASGVEIVRVFLNLEYMYAIEDIEVVHANNYDGEFTWFQTYITRGSRIRDRFNDISERIKREFDFELPEHIELDSNSFITISFGRKLQMLYYCPRGQLGEYPGDTSRVIVANLVFEREYHPNTVFVYRVSPLPQYRFADQVVIIDTVMQYNYYRNIPFEVWPHRREFSMQELEEPIHGFINVQETFLMRLPTGNSYVELRLRHGDYIRLRGYSDDGEDIDGDSRWYFAISSKTGHGTRKGFVHSSVVNIRE